MASLMLTTSERARSPLEQMLLDGTTPEDKDHDPLDAYDVVSAVGRGKFSTVYKAYRKADRIVVALKRIRMGDVGTSTAVKCLQEVQLLQSLNHRNIIHYLDSFACHPNTLVIVLEWATDGDLQHHLRRIKKRGGHLPEPVIWSSFVQICEALAHMHERRILHRDLKPANIFLHSDGTIKVGDLGLGRALSDHTPEAFSKVGTPLYMSPEALKGDGYDMKSDIWSLGCVLYELATLKSPFKEENLKMFQLFEKIVKCDYGTLLFRRASRGVRGWPKEEVNDVLSFALLLTYFSCSLLFLLAVSSFSFPLVVFFLFLILILFLSAQRHYLIRSVKI